MMSSNRFALFMCLNTLCTINVLGQYDNNPMPIDKRRSFGEYPISSQYSRKSDAQRMNLKGNVKFITEKNGSFLDVPIVYYQFDDNGNITAMMGEDERGIEKMYDISFFDGKGRYTGRHIVKNGSDLDCIPDESATKELPESDITRYAYVYSNIGVLANVVRWWRNSANIGLFQHDSKGRLLKETGTNGEIVTYTYYNNNIPQTATVKNSAKSKGDVYYYDEQGRNYMTVHEYEGKTTYTFNQKNQVVKAVSAIGQYAYEYDNYGNVTYAKELFGEHRYQYVYDSKGNWIKRTRNDGHVTTRTYIYDECPNYFSRWFSPNFVGSWGNIKNKPDGSAEYLYMDIDFNKHSIKDNFAENMFGTMQYKVKLEGGQPMTIASYYIYYIRQDGDRAIIKFKPYGPYADEIYDLSSAFQALLSYDAKTKNMKISNIISVKADGDKSCAITDQTMEYIGKLMQ